MSCIGCNMCTLCLREKKMKPTCRHFSWIKFYSGMEGKILLLCRQLDWWRGEMKELALETPPASSLQASGACWSREEEGKKSRYIHTLALNQRALGSLLVISIPSYPATSAHPIGKPWFLLKIQGHGICDSEIPWPLLAGSSASLSRRWHTQVLTS